jgi:hypothetical protein
MGYSLSLPCKSSPARDKLAGFLRANLRPFTLVCDEEVAIRDEWTAEAMVHSDRIILDLPDSNRSFDPTREIMVGRQIAYGASTSKIGFNFASSGDFSIYMHAVLSWAALHSGRRKGLNALAVVGHADQAVHYITYDRSPIPVVTVEDMAEWDQGAREYGEMYWQVDALGLRVLKDADFYAAHKFGAPMRTAEHRPLVERLYRRDKALRLITGREIQRLDALWQDS